MHVASSKINIFWRTLNILITSFLNLSLNTEKFSKETGYTIKLKRPKNTLVSDTLKNTSLAFHLAQKLPP